ncbi:MAG: hypothetical protein V7744_11720 [Pseudomonadales bacterium]
MMIELKNDRLVFNFPEVHPTATADISFQRTLRIPDDGNTYPLPAGLGEFPLSHIEDHAAKVPADMLKRGGVLMPMYQSEALWLNFSDDGYPMAIKVAAGKINAVTGKPWSDALAEQPQDYVVLPEQLWLDGYNVGEDLIRQFVAMPLGEGYTAEEQITGEAEFGGLQLIVYPMKAEVYYKLFETRSVIDDDMEFLDIPAFLRRPSETCESMGLAAGGLMRQEIYEDEYGMDVWDTESASRCFIHLCNSVDYAAITGRKPPHAPYTSKDYAQNGIPWFDYYGGEAKPLPGSAILGGLKSLAQIAKDKGEVIWGNETTNVGKVKVIKGEKTNSVSEGPF